MIESGMKFSTGGPVPRMFRAEIEGKLFEHPSIPSIFGKYAKWKAARGEKLDADWEDKVWLALMDNHPNHVKLVSKKARSGVSLATAMSFVRFVAKRLRKRSLVSPELARQRAAVCNACPLKEPVLGCSICKSALKAVVKPPEQVGAPPGCGACGCWLPAKVWIPRDILGGSDEHPFHASCWMRHEETGLPSASSSESS
jgi:hypothetical protein